MTVTLRAITRANWRESTRLAVREDQTAFVASNLFSIAQSKFYDSLHPVAIYDGETMVGFLMWGEPDEGETPGEYWIVRLMIDAAQQGKGYGRAAMHAILAELKAIPACKTICVSYEPENTVAAALYAGLGFEETGRIEHGEIVVQMGVRAE